MVILSSAFHTCVFVCGKRTRKGVCEMCGRCVPVAGVFHARASLCVSADMFANSINTAGRPHAGCLIVCLPWRTFYQTFVCKQIFNKTVSPLQSHRVCMCVCVCTVVFVCLQKCLCWCADTSEHRAPLTLKTKKYCTAVVESICLVFKSWCISEQMIFHYASLCFFLDNRD